MLKKQTVWLLTMLSLIIVLSVYYITTPSGNDLAFVENGNSGSEEATTENGEEGQLEADGMMNVGRDELFTTIRMELQDDRSMRKDRLNAIVASGTTSTDEKEQALKDIDVLEDIATKELILEETIIGSTGYQDVLVRTDGEKVHIHVKADQMSETEAVDIMQMVRDEFGEIKAEVNFQPTGE